jgi:hypothetical protein
MNFPEELKSWLETVLSQDVPDTVAAFSFNLFVLPSREAYGLELIGAGEFDQGNSDWARREIWAASPRYISIPNSFNCGDCLDCTHLLRQLLANFLRDSSAGATRLKESKAVAISFANEDLETFWLAAPQKIVRNLRQPSEAHIPGDVEWAGYEDDLDSRYAHEMFFGKSIEQVLRLFEKSDVLSRAEDLHYMPFAAFKYYIFAFARFVLSDRAAGDSSAANAFLCTLMERESEVPGCMSDLYVQLKPTVEFIATHQKYFDADPEIYGNFKDRAESLRAMCEFGE